MGVSGEFLCSIPTIFLCQLILLFEGNCKVFHFRFFTIICGVCCYFCLFKGICPGTEFLTSSGSFISYNIPLEMFNWFPRFILRPKQCHLILYKFYLTFPCGLSSSLFFHVQLSVPSYTVGFLPVLLVRVLTLVIEVVFFAGVSGLSVVSSFYVLA